MEWQEGEEQQQAKGTTVAKHFGQPLSKSLLEAKTVQLAFFSLTPQAGQEHVVFKVCNYIAKHGTHQQVCYKKKIVNVIGYFPHQPKQQATSGNEGDN